MIHRLPKPPVDDTPPVSTTRIKSSPPVAGPVGQMTSDLNDTMRSLGSAAARLSRIVNGRRASLPPAAAAFNSARRIAQSIPPGHLIPRRVSDIQTGALAKKASAGFVERNRTPTKSVSAAVDTRAPTSKTK